MNTYLAPTAGFAGSLGKNFLKQESIGKNIYIPFNMLDKVE